MLRNLMKWEELVQDDNEKAVTCITNGNEPCLRRKGSVKNWMPRDGVLTVDDHPWRPMEDRRAFERWRETCIEEDGVNPLEAELMYVVCRDRA